MVTTKHRGFWLHLEMIDGVNHDIIGISTLAELLYLVRRRYLRIPNLQSVTAYINQKELVFYEVVVDDTKERKYHNMTQTAVYSSFEDLERNWKPAVEDLPEFPWDDASVREALAAYAIPFDIVKAWEETSPFKDRNNNPQMSFRYHIRLHMDSPEYVKVADHADLYPTYTLTLTTGGLLIGKRRAVMEHVQRLITSGNGCVARLAKGGKSGKEYMLR